MPGIVTAGGGVIRTAQSLIVLDVAEVAGIAIDSVGIDVNKQIDNAVIFVGSVVFIANPVRGLCGSKADERGIGRVGNGGDGKHVGANLNATVVEIIIGILEIGSAAGSDEGASAHVTMVGAGVEEVGVTGRIGALDHGPIGNLAGRMAIGGESTITQFLEPIDCTGIGFRCGNTLIETPVLDDGLFPIPIHAECVQSDAEHLGIIESHDLSAATFQSGGVEEDREDVFFLVAGVTWPEADQREVITRLEFAIGIFSGGPQVDINSAGVIGTVGTGVIDKLAGTTGHVSVDEAGDGWKNERVGFYDGRCG